MNSEPSKTVVPGTADTVTLGLGTAWGERGWQVNECRSEEVYSTGE